MKTIVTLSLSIVSAILINFSFGLGKGAPLLALSLDSKPLLITSPQICLEDRECSKGQQCVKMFLNDSFTCRKQHDLGEACDASESEVCKDGLYCPSFDVDSPKKSTCTKKVGIGAVCERYGSINCANGAVCRASDSRCAPPNTGVAGDPCDRETDCLQNKGYYCDEDAGRCKRKLPPGGMCGYGSNYKCTGFCAKGGKNTDLGTCTATQPVGERCSDEMHCSNIIFPTMRTVKLLCNAPRGAEGICMYESSLLRYLGQPCNPKVDACDARRGLSCRWAPSLRRYACQQRADDWDEFVVRYCTPDSPLSVCKVFNGERQLCRLDAVDAPYGRVYNGFYGCLPPIITLPPGHICNWDGAVTCGPGYICARVSGVRSLGGFHPPPEGHFCVRQGVRGARCGSFSERCASGLTCVKGRCRPGSDPPEIPGKWTHASYAVDCSTLPCVPGLVCEKSVGSDELTCTYPTRIMRQGQPCRGFPQTTVECAPGLTCARNHAGRGQYLCRRPAPLGAACEGERPCIGNLKCSGGWTSPRSTGRCYDPARVIPLGSPCNPGPQVGERQCSVTGNLELQRTVLCLPKGDAFACQYAAALFQQCDSQLNISCVGQNVCSNIGVCIPPNSSRNESI